jgi:hypothetical protein
MHLRASLCYLITGIVITVFFLGACTPTEAPTEAVGEVLIKMTESPIPTDPPPPTEPPPGPTAAPIPITNFEDLAGTWLRSSRGFNYKLEVYLDGGAKSTVMFITPYTLTFENGQLHALNSIEFPDCPVNTLGIYEVSGVPGKYLVFELIEDPCQTPRGFRGKWTEASDQ